MARRKQPAAECCIHEGVEATWVCSGCGATYCDGCAAGPIRGIGRPCPGCGGRCEPIAAPTRRGTVGFLVRLPDALAYPVRGDGKWILAGAAIVLPTTILILSVPLVALVIGFLMGGFLASYVFRVVSQSAGGDYDPPDWPDVTSPFGDLVLPALLFLASVLVCVAPAFAYRAVARTSETVPFSETGFWVLLALGLFVLPMSLLGVALCDSLGGLNPLRIVPAIVRTLPTYLLAWGVLALVGAVGVAIIVLVDLLPGVLGRIVGWLVVLYLLMVGAHVLGLYCSMHDEKFESFGA